MDGFQFTAAIFASFVSLAWPVATVICVWLFRHQLSALLPNLRLKHKDWEISFRLDEAAKVAQKLVEPPGEEAPPTPEEKQRFDEIAKLSPRAAVLEMRANLEEALRNFAEAIGMDARRQSLGMLTRKLSLHFSN
jgi:hypothetical protein